MNIESKSVFGLLVCFGIIILISMIRSKHFFSCLLLSCLSGVAALFAVNLLSAVTGFELAVNPVTLAVSAVGGTPGVVLLLVSRIFLL